MATPAASAPTPPQHLQDIYTLFHLHRDFKFISKTSNFLIPIIGWSMFLTGAYVLCVCVVVVVGGGGVLAAA